MDWLISIVLFIVALGLLICLHELGHFSMAKLFNVYCHEFSIGFGPALVHVRKKGKETYFSIRAIPLGGYVAMHGEEDEEIEPGLVIPPERSIEGIAKWKKAIVVSAGIIVNALLALIIFGVKNFAFNPIYVTTELSKSNECALVLNEGDHINFLHDELNQDYGYVYQYKDSSGKIFAGEFYIIDNDVQINDYHYVLAFDYYTNKTANNLSKGLVLYQGIKSTDTNWNAQLNSMFKNWVDSASPATYYPDFTRDTYEPSSSTSFVADFSIRNGESITTTQVTITGNDNKQFNDLGLYLNLIEVELPFGEKLKGVFTDFGDSSVAVFEGLGTLFSKGGIQNMSGIVGIFSSSKTVLSNYTFATYLKFWGLISVNLAIFNLLPFPGLDGWQLVVTAIEGISKKKISSKFKSIMSLIGFALLILLMIAVLVVDIGRLII